MRLNILKMANVDPDIRVKDLTEDQESALREVIDKHYTIEGDLRRESRDEHQAADGDRLLSWCASSPRPAGQRAAHEDECQNPQGPEEDHCE